MAKKRPNGSGMNPRKRPDGRWEVRVFVLTTEGSWKRVSVYGKSPEEVEAKATELKSQRDKGIPVSTTPLSVRDFLRDWLADEVRPNARPKTYEGYATNVNKHIVPLIGRKRLSRLTIRDVQAMAAQLSKSGLKPRTVRYVHATLRAALNHAVRSELVARNVAQHVQVRGMSDASEERRALTPKQGKLLLARAGGERLYAAYVLGLIGLRRGEILGLRWSDVDLDKRTLAVRQTVQRVDGALRMLPPKSRRSRRTLPLPLFVVAALRTQGVFQECEREVAGDRWHDSGLVITSPIGTPLDPRNFHREWQVFRDGVEGVPPVKFHELRHTCVSLLLEVGVSPRVVMEIVGHAGLDMTMNTYGHVRLEVTRDALDQLGGLFIDQAQSDDEAS